MRYGLHGVLPTYWPGTGVQATRAKARLLRVRGGVARAIHHLSDTICGGLPNAR